MGERSRIRWTDSTWNPMTGCTPVTEACDHCYSQTIAEKLRGSLSWPKGFDRMHRPHRLEEPTRWKKPRRVFVNSMSDLFHRAFTEADLDAVFQVMQRED